MGLYIDFPNYSCEDIQRMPQVVRVPIGTKKYLFEVSYNRVSQGLNLKIMNEVGTKVLSYMPITAGVDLSALARNADFPAQLFITGKWVIKTQKSIAEAFMTEFKLYVGGLS